MYIRPKKVFWSLVLLAAVLYAGAHLLVRTSWARAQVLRGLSVRTGYAASASEIRLTPGLALSFRDFRLEIPGAAGADAAARAVVEAPWLRVGRCRGGWAVRAPRARLAAYRENGVWTPSQATGAEECPGACVFPRISPAFGSLWLDLADAQVSLVDGAETTAFAGVSWTRAPVRIPGRPGAVQNRLSWLKGPIRGDVTTEMAVRGSDEWYELPGGIARLATQGAPAAPSGSPAGGAGERSEPEGVFSAEAGVIGGEDGPTSIWLSSKAEGLPPKEDMVEMFREFFETDPETAKAFFEAADEARGAKETHAEPAENAEPASGGASSPSEPPAPEANPHAEPAENAEPASGGASSPSEPPAAEANPHAENAESAELASGGAIAPSEPPAPEANPHAENAKPAEPASGGASSPSEPSPAEEKPNAPAS